METILLIGLIFFLLFGYGIFSHRLSTLSISGPMVFTVFGLLFYYFNLTESIHIESETLELIGKVALIAILFTDASNISIKDFFRLYNTPIRLLFLGLPITMLLGAGVAFFFFPQFDLLLLAVLAFILSPTDAALGQAVVQSPNVPPKIREAINVESGLNDGLVLPPILICIAFLGGGTNPFEDINIWGYVSKQILFALAIGGTFGWLGSKLINWSVKKKFANHLYYGICVVAISILSFVIAEYTGGNGYIATFVSGLFFNADTKELKNNGQEFGEFLSQPLTLFVFLIFGASILPHYASFITLNVIIYAILSLTLLRIIPVLIGLLGSKIPLGHQLFIAWFGPRGIASILYLLLAFESLPHTTDNNTVFGTIVLTVALSIFAHGLTAVPFSNRMKKK